MWVFLSDAFLSIVRSDQPGKLLVRARVPGDIKRVFPAAKIRRTPERDYLFRALVPAGEVADAIAGRIEGIDYANFKDSVWEPFRHRACSRVWSEMLAIQARPRRRGRPRHDDPLTGFFPHDDRWPFDR